MSLIACKYFNEFGFVAIKVRDKNYKPDIMIRKSFRRDTERLYIWDIDSRFSEGINEYGVTVLSLEQETYDKELLANRLKVAENSIRSPRKFQSEDGIRVRSALFGKSVEEATEILLGSEAIGTFLVLDSNNCNVVNAAIADGEYTHNIQKCERHTGYLFHSSDEEYTDIVLNQLNKELLYARQPIDLLDSIAIKVEDGSGVIKTDITRRKLKTVSQTLICPEEKTIHFRPIYGNVRFNLDRLINNSEQKTAFEIVSTRKLMSYKDYNNEKN